MAFDAAQSAAKDTSSQFDDATRKLAEAKQALETTQENLHRAELHLQNPSTLPTPAPSSADLQRKVSDARKAVDQAKEAYAGAEAAQSSAEKNKNTASADLEAARRKLNEATKQLEAAKSAQADALSKLLNAIHEVA